MQTLEEILKGARASLRDDYAVDDEYMAQEVMHEIADAAVPTYSYELCQLAADNLGELALTEPEMGPAFDGAPTPINIIAANVYEAVKEALREEWQEIEEERAGE